MTFRNLLSGNGKKPEFATTASPLRRIESWMFLLLIGFKCQVLWRTWGHPQGYDAGPWLQVFQATHWFAKLPGPRQLFYSYHPPLAFLIARLLEFIVLKPVEASQLLATIGMIGAACAIRGTLRRLDFFYSVIGMTFFYFSFSIPIVVWLGIETSQDSLSFGWWSLSLYLAVSIFWGPLPSQSKLVIRQGTGLAVVYGLGLLTKTTNLLAFFTPFFVIALGALFDLIAARSSNYSVHGQTPLRSILNGGGRKTVLATIIGMTGFLLALPYLYFHNYRAEGRLFPVSMEWQVSDQLTTYRAMRDADRVGFVMNMLRLPEHPKHFHVGQNADDPAMDSLPASTWFQTWRRPWQIGRPTPVPEEIGRVYYYGFVPLLFLGPIAFFLLYRRLPRPVVQFSLLLMATSLLASLFLLKFAYDYPMWPWTVFKTKYVIQAVLWLGMSFALIVECRNFLPPRFRGPLAKVAFLFLLIFMSINHLIPVY